MDFNHFDTVQASHMYRLFNMILLSVPAKCEKEMTSMQDFVKPGL